MRPGGETERPSKKKQANKQTNKKTGNNNTRGCSGTFITTNAILNQVNNTTIVGVFGQHKSSRRESGPTYHCCHHGVRNAAVAFQNSTAANDHFVQKSLTIEKDRRSDISHIQVPSGGGTGGSFCSTTLLLIPELCNKVRGVLHYTVVFPPSISFNKHRQTQRPPHPGQSQPTQTHAVAATAAPPQKPTHRKKFGYNISTPFETSTYQSSNRQTKKVFGAKQRGNNRGMFPGKSDTK